MPGREHTGQSFLVAELDGLSHLMPLHELSLHKASPG